MQHETATVKKVVKRYTTKKGVKKESISYKITFKSDFAFDDGDDVAVVLLDDFKDLDNISADEIQNLKNDAADKDKIIAANNESIATFKADSKEKSDKIAALSKQIKATEKTIAEIESDVSAKDKTITELTVRNDELHSRLSELTDLLTAKDKTIDKLDADIVDYKVKVAELSSVDVDKLRSKADEVDNLKNELVAFTKRLDDKSNIITLLQNQIRELQQVVNYKSNLNDKLENKGALDCIFNRDVTAGIVAPDLDFVDLSGNLIKENSAAVDVNATVGDNDDAAPDDDSGKDTLTII